MATAGYNSFSELIKDKAKTLGRSEAAVRAKLNSLGVTAKNWEKTYTILQKMMSYKK